MIDKNPQIILTIGIPVYNGATYIQDAINSIVIPKGYENKIEIIVSDNCSTDNINEILKQHQNIKYYKNKENLGYDKNVHNVFLKAKGNFVWTLAADDIISCKEAIQDVLNIIENENDIGIIHVGGCTNLKLDYEIFKDELFLITSNFQSGAVSTNIIRKDAWLQSKPTVFFQSGWIHFGAVIKIIKEFKSVITKKQYASESPATINLLKSWDINGSGLRLALKLVELFNQMEDFGYTRLFKKKAKMLIKKEYPKAIIKAKANDLEITKELVGDFIKLYKEYFTFWVVDLPILLLPNKFCKYIYHKRNTFSRIKGSI